MIYGFKVFHLVKTEVRQWGQMQRKSKRKDPQKLKIRSTESYNCSSTKMRMDESLKKKGI